MPVIPPAILNRLLAGIEADNHTRPHHPPMGGAQQDPRNIGSLDAALVERQTLAPLRLVRSSNGVPYGAPKNH